MLNFIKPKIAPHGLLGATAIVANMATTTSGITNIDIPPEFMQFTSYLSLFNAMSSLFLLPRNDCIRRSLFVESIRFQSVLSYMGIRVFYLDELFTFTDGFASQQFLLSMFNMWKLSDKVPDDVNPIGFKFIILLASLLGCYPLQFAILGTDFITQLYEKYPDQALAFSKYVYCPSQLVTMIIMFSATLLQRNIIQTKDMKLWFIMLPVIVFASTVTAQEIYIPDTATQDLIINLSFTNPVYLFKEFKHLLHI